MLLRFLTAAFFLLATLRCSGPGTMVPLADLDYVEVADQTGWVLRIHGDGAGSLSHRQLPAYHLHYPAQTFLPGPGRYLAERCRGGRETPVCFQISYYEAMADGLTRCSCASGDWPAEVMGQAIEQMQYAVDAGGSERSCRMLRRLASR